jgi:hypothetical protein
LFREKSAATETPRGERADDVKVPSFIFLRYRLQHLQQDLRCFAGALHF